MSTDWRVVVCQGKATFDSWHQANQVRDARGRRNDRMNQRQVYKCDFCGKFHLGTPSSKKRRRRG